MFMDLRRLDKFVGLETLCEVTNCVQLPLILISRIYSTFYELCYRNGLLNL
jgi:hypothetical protein